MGLPLNEHEMRDLCAFLTKDLPEEERAHWVEWMGEVVGPGDPLPDGHDRAIDINLTGEGGRAFLWKDALALSNALDAAMAAIAEFRKGSVSVETILVKALYGTLRRLREIGVELSADEVKVLRAVKKHMSTRATRAAIAAYTSLPPETVESCVSSLKVKQSGGRPLIEERVEDVLWTDF